MILYVIIYHNKKLIFFTKNSDLFFKKVSDNQKFKTVIDSTYDVWRVDTKGLTNKWYLDTFYNKGVVTDEPIPPSNIKLIKKSL